MNKDLPLQFDPNILKMLHLKHLTDAEVKLLRERKIDKDSMCWVVLHLSECSQCCVLAPILTVQEIKDALAGTPYGKTDFVKQTINYYFQTLKSSDSE